MHPAPSFAFFGLFCTRALARVLIGVACLVGGWSAWAVDHNDVQKLLRQAKDKEALALVETALPANAFLERHAAGPTGPA